MDFVVKQPYKLNHALAKRSPVALICSYLSSWFLIAACQNTTSNNTEGRITLVSSSNARHCQLPTKIVTVAFNWRLGCDRAADGRCCSLVRNNACDGVNGETGNARCKMTNRSWAGAAAMAKLAKLMMWLVAGWLFCLGVSGAGVPINCAGIITDFSW